MNKDTLKITVSGPIGIGKTTLLAKIFNEFLSGFDIDSNEVEITDRNNPSSPRYQKQLFKEVVFSLKNSPYVNPSVFLKEKGIRKIILKQK